MVIKVKKVNASNVSLSGGMPVFYGLVVALPKEGFMNYGRVNEIFDEEKVRSFMEPGKTLVKYSGQAIRGEEIVNLENKTIGGINEEIYHYLFLGDFVVEVGDLDTYTDGAS